jgi:hypothetical protein
VLKFKRKFRRQKVKGPVSLIDWQETELCFSSAVSLLACGKHKVVLAKDET